MKNKTTQVLVSLATGLSLFVWGISNSDTRVAAATSIAQADPNASLLDGPGKSVTVATCTKCHAITNITGVHKDRDSWAETLSKMVGYGATASDEDLQTILDYLSKYYGTEAPTGDAAEPTHAKIAINKETAAQLSTDVGLTADEAAALVNYRTKNGEFKSIDDLKRVPNVDGRKFDAKKDDLQF